MTVKQWSPAYFCDIYVTVIFMWTGIGILLVVYLLVPWSTLLYIITVPENGWENSPIINLNWKHNGFFNVFIHRWCHTSVFVHFPNKYLRRKTLFPWGLFYHLCLHIVCISNWATFIYWQLYTIIYLWLCNLEHLDQSSSHSSPEKHMRVVNPLSGGQSRSMVRNLLKLCSFCCHRGFSASKAWMPIW